MSITGQLLACYDDEAGAQANPTFTPDKPCNGTSPSGAGCSDPGGNGSVDAGHGCGGCGARHGAGADANGGRSAPGAGAAGGGQGPQGADTLGKPPGADGSGAGGGPVAVSSLLAHLLFLRANGGLAGATALADTFGTAAFAAAAAAARVPAEFADDMRALHPADPPVPHGTCCFTVALKPIVELLWVACTLDMMAAAIACACWTSHLFCAMRAAPPH